MTKVIVVITTYNLEEYIEKCLQSVLDQKTNFEYKVLIGDDASSDGTINIIRKMEERYPQTIITRYSEKNLGSLQNSNRLFDRLDCEYFSFLDGDDEWVDNERLQKQVDFLDNHKEYIIAAGNTRYVYGDTPGEKLLSERQLGRTYCFEDYTSSRMPFFHTSSMLCRNVVFINGLPKCYLDSVGTFRECAFRGEDFRRILHLEQGPLYAFKEVFSAYRIHSKGMWQGSTKTRKIIENMISDYCYYEIYGNKYNGYFKNQARFSFESGMIRLFSDSRYRNTIMTSEKDKSLLLDYLDSYNIESDIVLKGPRESFRDILLRLLIKVNWKKED